jgi:hypothetical protein
LWNGRRRRVKRLKPVAGSSIDPAAAATAAGVVDKSRVAVGAGAGSSCCCLWASFIITCRYAAGVECRPLAHTLAPSLPWFHDENRFEISGARARIGLFKLGCHRVHTQTLLCQIDRAFLPYFLIPFQI